MAAAARGSARPLPVVAVVGATASGKSELALDLAERLDGEVVNTDAFQLYRGMDIGTAKLAPEERRGLPHHLLDVLEVSRAVTVAEYQGWARDVIAEVRARGRVPVLVGGSALYTRAVLDRFDFPGTDATVRARLEGELAEVGVGVLHARLRDLDPEAAGRIEPGNGRRVVRALEVVEITGRPFSASLPVQEYVDPVTVQVGVDLDRDVLDRRVAERVGLMWRRGLVGEVEALLPHGLAQSRTASRAIGYQQVLALLAGELTDAEAQDSTVRATRRFVRRQDAWFRKDDRVAWVRGDDPHRADRAVAAVEAVT